MLKLFSAEHLKVSVLFTLVSYIQIYFLANFSFSALIFFMPELL
jgi:hypothetical protein